MDIKHLVGETSLDPLDWEAMRALAHRMVDDMMDYQENVRQRPVWQPVPEEVKSNLALPLPVEGQPTDQVYQDFLENVLPYPMGNIHPRFWGWVMGNGTPLGMMAEMLAAGMNPNMGGGNHGGVYVENQVIAWFKEIFGFPVEASGVLVSGASMANLIGLAVARTAKAGFDLRTEGLQASAQKMTVYGSVEMHSSIQKAAELLGLGSSSLRKVAVDDHFRIDLAALESAISSDRARGLHPICVVGCAGTVNTGAMDDLAALAEICRRENLWFHVDGAFGALVALTDEHRHLADGIDQADSLAFDLHKWLYMPFEAGCILVREDEAHRNCFSLTPSYLAHQGERGLASGAHWYSDYGVQLTRGFRALKVWMSLKEHGLRKYGSLIAQNISQARYLRDLVIANPDLELLAPVDLNIVCFRYKPADFPGEMDGETLNELNQELLLRLHESGSAVPTYTTLNERYGLRAAITNHRSRLEDFDFFIQEVTRLGRELAHSFFPQI